MQSKSEKIQKCSSLRVGHIGRRSVILSNAGDVFMYITPNVFFRFKTSFDQSVYSPYSFLIFFIKFVDPSF